MDVSVKLVMSADVAREWTFTQVALPGDDPATISNADLKARIERVMEMEPGELRAYIVDRPTTGQLLVMPDPKFGVDIAA